MKTTKTVRVQNLLQDMRRILKVALTPFPAFVGTQTLGRHLAFGTIGDQYFST